MNEEINVSAQEQNSVEVAESSTPPPSTQTIDWRSSVTDETLRNDPSLATIKDVNGLVKSYVSSQRMLGGRIPIPSADASAEVREEFYNKVTSIPDVVRLPNADDPKASEQYNMLWDKLGRPKSPDGYKLESVEGSTFHPDQIQAVKEMAHKVGLTQGQLQALVDQQVGYDKAMVETFTRQREETRTMLQKEWGNAYSDNMNYGKAVLGKFAAKFPEAVKEITESALGNNPIVIMALSELGRVYSENGTIAPNSSMVGGRTPEQALQQIQDIRGNPKHAFYNEKDPGHEEAVMKVRALYKDAYPDENQ